MKTLPLEIACLTAFVIGCSTPDELALPPWRAAKSLQQERPSRLESIDYDWEEHGVRVSFYRQNSDSAWTMQVKDAWSIYDQLTKDERVWKVSESRCSVDEGLRIMDQSLSLFYAEKPTAKLAAVDVEMEVIRDMWADTLAGFNKKLTTLKTTKRASRADVPDEVDDELLREANTSPNLKKIEALLNEHGLSVRGIYPSEITFKDSLTGYKWSYICKLPGAGVLVPGIFEFKVGESGSQSASR